MTYTRLVALPDAVVPSSPTARQALLNAFAELALSRRYREFGVAAITGAASVARSTFYYHFSGKDEILLQILQPFIAAMADMAFTPRPSDELQHWVAHVWQQRRIADRLLDGATGRKIEAALVACLSEAFAIHPVLAEQSQPLLVQQIAGASLSLLKAWVGHSVTGTPGEIATALWSSAVSIRAGCIASTI